MAIARICGCVLHKENKMTPIYIANPRYEVEDQTVITLDVKFEELGDVLLQFGATPNDVEAHGRDLYVRAVAGEFGEIAPYVAPVVVAAENQPTTTGAQTL
jgi:hypothetical protein